MSNLESWCINVNFSDFSVPIPWQGHMRWQRLGDRICVGCLCKVESKIPLGGETKKVLTERKAKFLNLCGTTGNTDPNPNPGTLNPNRRIPSNLKVILIFVGIHGAC